jgi:hypothetical protein
MKLLSKLTLLALPVLAACGGGGSDQTCGNDFYLLDRVCVPKTTHTLPEGIWYGATNTGLAAQTIVLENGQYYSVYTSTGGAFTFMTEGVMTATNGAISDPAAVALMSNGVLVAASVTGTFTAKSAFANTFTIATSPTATQLNFNGNYNAIYDTSIAVSDVIGNWTNPATVSTVATVSFAADGSLTGANGACTFTGSVKPRSTGKHLLDGTLNFTSASCAAGNGVSMPIEATVVNSQLTIVGVTPQRNAAFYLAATR